MTLAHKRTLCVKYLTQYYRRVLYLLRTLGTDCFRIAMAKTGGAKWFTPDKYMIFGLWTPRMAIAPIVSEWSLLLRGSE